MRAIKWALGATAVALLVSRISRDADYLQQAAPVTAPDFERMENLLFLDSLVDLGSVAAQADWVINHANHSTAAVFTQAGLPQLLIPQQQLDSLLLFRVKQMPSYGFLDGLSMPRQACCGNRLIALELAHPTGQKPDSTATKAN